VEAIRIKTGATEPIEVLAVDSTDEPLIGLSNLKLRIRRQSDGYFFDWSDNSFKGTAAQPLIVLDEIDGAKAPGEYRLNASPHVKGFNTAAIVNANANDTYFVTALQDGGGSAVGFPMRGEIKVGDFIDLIDQAISDNASPAEVLQALRDFGLDHLVSVNPGIVPPAAGTYIRQILDKLNQSQTHFLEMSFSYNPDNDTFVGNAWIESGNLVVVNSGAIVVDLYDENRTLIFSMADATPDAGGVFKVSRTPTGLVKNRSYYAEATVTLPDTSTVRGIKGMFTIA
jgi:hypothetical protein